MKVELNSGVRPEENVVNGHEPEEHLIADEVGGHARDEVHHSSAYEGADDVAEHRKEYHTRRVTDGESNAQVECEAHEVSGEVREELVSHPEGSDLIDDLEE